MDQWVDDDAADDQDSKKNDEKKKEVAGIAADTAEPSIIDESNVIDTIDDGMSMRKPTGRVVGIADRSTPSGAKIRAKAKTKERKEEG